MPTGHHAIQAAARLSGLSAYVIRIWEKRYGAVKPERTGTNRRLYTEGQIERLILLRDLREAGYNIGQIARMPTEKLRQLAGEAVAETRQPAGALPVAALLAEGVEAVKALDAKRLEVALERASVVLGSQGLLQRVVAPLAIAVGELWREGTITAAHEHFASAVLRVFLWRATAAFGGAEHAPVLVVATPAGQLHELGALLAGAAAANVGWRVTYLGASLPAAEIAGAVRQSRARAVALSLVYPEDDARLEGELARLRELLPPEVPVLCGGRAAPTYHTALEKIGAREIKDLAALGVALDALRHLPGQSR
jgi:DNA-binding transcriptional MerR regulator/methylmalonyl-CoA mutase cobalamin-binding subunit